MGNVIDLEIPTAARIAADDLSDLQLDKLVLDTIPLKDRQTEAALFRVKWFDYRTMHPARATIYYAHAYVVAYRLFYLKGTGTEIRDNSPMRPGNELLNPFAEDSSVALAYWRGRQLCDEAGMPYLFYCMGYFRLAMEYMDKLPRPNQMWHHNAAGPTIGNWEVVANSYYPTAAIFKLRDNWADLPVQHEWEAQLVAGIRDMPPAVAVSALQYAEPYMRCETEKRLREAISLST